MDSIIGYTAASASIIGFGSQFIHTYRTKTVSGISITRTLFDTLSLAFWLAYAARSEDIPLLIATTFELITSVAVLVIVMKHRRYIFISVKDNTPPPSPPTSSPNTSDSAAIDIIVNEPSLLRTESTGSAEFRLERRNSI
jgi:uncharacterized protein with PQ loop repeat